MIMKDLDFLLIIIAVLPLLIHWKVSAINARLEERFPTGKKQDFEWARRDPLGHSETHRKDAKQK
jgi:hypothetical protein